MADSLPSLIIITLSSLFLIISFPSTSSASPIPPQLIEALLKSNHVAMALTLQLNSQTLIPSPAATIFSPPDSSFSNSGQPSLSLLRYHIVSRHLSPENLQTLSLLSSITSLSPNQTLTVTNTAPSTFSVNSVTVNLTSLYDDSLFIVYGIDRFFGPSFSSVPAPIPAPFPPPVSDLGILCRLCPPANSGSDYFSRASRVLNANGYSVMASLLELQLMGIQEGLKVTVFAPVDPELSGLDYRGYPSLLKRHVIPCKLSLPNLRDDVADGRRLPTFMEGFEVHVSNSGDVLVNGVSILYPDMYVGEFVAVHGIKSTM